MPLEPYPYPIPYARQCIDETDIAAVVEALRSDFVTQGPRISAFEDALCEYTGARYAVAVSSGTAALHLSCLGLGLGKGDVGIVPAITFAATANCLRYAGVEVAFCDVDPVSGLSTPAHFESALENVRRAKVLLPVSFSGAVPGLAKIRSLAARAGAYVIEDAAHSIGACCSDGSASASCAHSDAAILSFHPVKHICAGEGGAVLTNDLTLARRLRKLRSHGIEKTDAWLYDQSELGFNYRMTEMQAALGLSQIERLPQFIAKRRELVERYRATLTEEPYASRIRISNADSNSSHHLFVAHFKDEAERSEAYDFFHARNVRVQVHYLPVYRHSYYRELGHSPTEGAESFYASCLSLPLYPSLKDEEQAYVLDCLRAFLEQ